MEPLRWVLLLIGLLVLGLIFAQSRGYFPTGRRIRALFKARRRSRALKLDPVDVAADPPLEEEYAEPEPEKPVLADDSRVITIRILPQPGESFPAEGMVLALRNAGLRHGKFKIFHRMTEDDSRIRYSVASLVEPGSFDLNKLSESEYNGVSMFMVIPSPEDGVALFDDMMTAARAIVKEVDGRLLDEQGGALSMQRERYLREEIIEFLRLKTIPAADQDEAVNH